MNKDLQENISNENPEDDDIRKNINKHFKKQKKFIPRKKSKGFILKAILIFFVLGVLVVGGFFLYNFIGESIKDNMTNEDEEMGQVIVSNSNSDDTKEEREEIKIIDEVRASDDLYENQDEDNDGLTTVQEMGLGTKSMEKDTDTDGIPDGWEVIYGLDPLEYSDALADEDEDRLTNIEEYKYKTDPQNSDTDDDGYGDGNEVSGGYNPKGKGKL